MTVFYYKNKMIIRNITIIFILLYSLFSSDNLSKYILGGMGIVLVLLNLKQEFETKK